MAIRLAGSGQTYPTLLAAADSIRAIGSLTENEMIELTDNKQYDYSGRDDLNFIGLTLNGFKVGIRPSPSVRFTVTLDAGDPYNLALMTFTGARLRGSGNFGLYNANRLEPEDILIINDGESAVFNNSDTIAKRCVCIRPPGPGQNFRMGGGAAVAIACTFINGDIGIEYRTGTDLVDQCSVFNCAVAYDDRGQTVSTEIRNNLAYDCTVGWNGVFTNPNNSNNASEDGTHPGSNGVLLTGNPFESDFMTPAAGSQLADAGFDFSTIPTDVAGKPFQTVTRAIGSNEVFLIAPPQDSEVLRRRRGH